MRPQVTHDDERGNVLELLSSGGILLLLDRWSKRGVEACVANRCIPWGRLVRLRQVYNSRKAYERAHTRALMALTWFAALASALFLYRAGISFQSHAARIGLGSALGGAAGNLLDIWLHRSITDFVDLGWWPVFNVADVGITIGIFLAFWPQN